MNLGITCDICSQENFTGKRYQCQTCLPSVNFDVCSSCLPKVDSFHPRHKWAFVPNPSKIHANRILMAKRAIALLKNAGSNVGDRDDATGWRMSHAQRVLAVDTLELKKLIAAAEDSPSESSFDGSILNHSFDTLLGMYSQALVQDASAAYLKNIEEDMSSLSVNHPTTSQWRTQGSRNHSSDLASSQWLQDFLEKQQSRNEEEEREREEERKREEAEEERKERIREKVIRDKIIYEKIIEKKRVDKFYEDKYYKDKRISEQYQTANRLAQERSTQQHIENQRVAQEQRATAIREQHIRDQAIQQQRREEASRQQRR